MANVYHMRMRNDVHIYKFRERANVNHTHMRMRTISTRVYIYPMFVLHCTDNNDSDRGSHAYDVHNYTKHERIIIVVESMVRGYHVYRGIWNAVIWTTSPLEAGKKKPTRSRRRCGMCHGKCLQSAPSWTTW